MREAAPARNVWFGVLLFVVALVPRLWVALAWAGEPVWDGHYYDFGARRIAEGLGYSDDRTVGGQLVWHPWCHYPVGYSAFLAAFYRLFGASPIVAGVANALVGAALAVATWALARYAMSERRARVAGFVVALYPGLVLYAALIMSEPLAALLTASAFWLAVRDARGSRGLALGAAVLGLAALVRPQALLCAPFLSLTRFSLSLTPPPLRSGSVPATTSATAGMGGARPLPPHPPAGTESVALAGTESVPPAGPESVALAGTESVPLAGHANAWVALLRDGVVATAVALCVVLPWTVRNCRVMDGCALVSTNAGWNLAIGAFPRATGRFETLRSSDGCRDVTGQVQQDRCWLGYGLEQIRAAPMRWFALIPAKLGYTFDHESFAVEYLHEARPATWLEPRRAALRGVTTFAYRLVLGAAAFGAIAFPARNRARDTTVQGALAAAALSLGALAFLKETPLFWPLAVFAGVIPWLPMPGSPSRPPALLLGAALLDTTLLAHAVFFGEDRYHVVVIPVLALFAAGALRRSTFAPA